MSRPAVQTRQMLAGDVHKIMSILRRLEKTKLVPESRRKLAVTCLKQAASILLEAAA